MVEVLPALSEGDPHYSSASPQTSTNLTPPVESVMKTMNVQAKVRPSYVLLISAEGTGRRRDFPPSQAPPIQSYCDLIPLGSRSQGVVVRVFQQGQHPGQLVRNANPGPCPRPRELGVLWIGLAPCALTNLPGDSATG